MDENNCAFFCCGSLCSDWRRILCFRESTGLYLHKKGEQLREQHHYLKAHLQDNLLKAATTLELYYTAATFFSKGLQHDLSKLLRNVKEPCFFEVQYLMPRSWFCCSNVVRGNVAVGFSGPRNYSSPYIPRF
jgi:hypothetical protein